MNKRALGWLVAIIAVVLVLYGVSKRQTPAPADGGAALPDVVKIGSILPLTGGGGPYGIPARRAMEIAVEEVNAAGGIAGKPVEVVWGDGKCGGADAATEAQKMVSVDGVKVIFGGYCSGETIAAAPITEQAKVLLISPGSSSPKITSIGDFVFRTYPSDALAGKVAAEYARNILKLQKVAVVSEQTDYAQGLRGAFKDAFSAGGGAVSGDEVFQTGTSDFRTLLLKVKETNPEAVYVAPQTGDAGVLLLQQLKEIGYTGARITAEVLMDRKLATDNAALFEELVGVEAGIDDADPKYAAFLAKYKEKYNEDPGGIPLGNANAYSQVYLLKDAIETVGYDTAKIRDWLYDLKDWSGGLGTLTFDENGDPITGYFGIRQVKGGAVTTLGTQLLVNGTLEPFAPAAP